MGIDGDEGGRQVLRDHPDEVLEVELDEERPILDVDSREDLQRLEASM